MTHGSLFSGIGGFDLAAEWAGWINVFHCEINPFGQKVLKYYWPNAISYDDITKTDFTIHRGRIDVLTGGFPCQPFSVAGKRKGTEDHRNLWPEYFRAIKEIQPLWVVGENVPGLINWSGGLVFEQVQADLESEGYEVWPVILPACSVNAPHKRERVWFVAHRNCAGLQEAWPEQQTAGITRSDTQRTASNSKGWRLERQRKFREVKQSSKNIWTICPDEGTCWTAYNSKRIGWAKSVNDNGIIAKTQQEKCGKFKPCRTNSTQDWWRQFPSKSPVCSGNDGLSDRLDGITFSKWRNESIKAYGNAIVPQVAYQIFMAINEFVI